MNSSDVNRIQRITELIGDTQAGADGSLEDLTDTPSQFLVVEYDEEMVELFALGSTSLEDAARFIDDSETHRDSVKVYDLDTGETWVPQFRTVKFVEGGKAHGKIYNIIAESILAAL